MSVIISLNSHMSNFNKTTNTNVDVYFGKSIESQYKSSMCKIAHLIDIRQFAADLFYTMTPCL